MKKKELLYRAVGGLDDGTVNDAMKHEAEKRDHSRLFTVLEGAAIVAVVCGLAVLSLLMLKISGPNVKNDPDPVSTPVTAVDGETEDTNGTVTENKTETDTDGAPFYALNAEQTYEKYGIVSFVADVNMDNLFDGKYIYAGYWSIQSADMNTISRYEYPNSKSLQIACTDPLCTHTDGSCPFYGANPFDFACYEGKMYFVTSYNEIRCYDSETNKSVKLFGNCQRTNAMFFKYDGNLYLHYNEYRGEPEGSPATKKFVMITPDGNITELGQLDWDDLYSDFGIIYKDKYYVDYKPEDGGIRVLLRDIKTGGTKTAAVIECSSKMNTDDNSMSYMLYGDQLLVRVKHYEVWLVDLKTGEKRLVFTPHYDIYGTYKAWCLFSQRCCMWHEPRQNESDPLILHVLFPNTGEEMTYDLSKAVYDATGDTIPLDLYILDMANSAVRLRKTINDRSHVIYEIDLENGNARKIAE